MRESEDRQSRPVGDEETRATQAFRRLLAGEIESHEFVAVLRRETARPVSVHGRMIYEGLRVENEKMEAALREIATRPVVERNPDGFDQAAYSMQLIASEALGLNGKTGAVTFSELSSALRKYGGHLENCGLGGGDGGDRCDCGLDAVLTAMDPSSSGPPQSAPVSVSDGSGSDV